MTDITADADWKLVTDSVFQLFSELDSNEYTPLGDRLHELGFADIESEYPLDAQELLFRAQGKNLTQTDCLYRVMLAEFPVDLRADATAVLLPPLGRGRTAGQVEGILLGPHQGNILVPRWSGEAVTVAVVPADALTSERIDTFDATAQWTLVRGEFDHPGSIATAQWSRAWSAAQRGLATELVALADQLLTLAAEHVTVRKQFGTPIGSLQSPRHALASAHATVEGARALLTEAWRYGGPMGAQGAKASAGRAHRAAADVALQVCGAIGLTAEHAIHRYVARGFQLNPLCGSPSELDTQIANRLFDSYPADLGLPTIIAAG